MTTHTKKLNAQVVEEEGASRDQPCADAQERSPQHHNGER